MAQPEMNVLFTSCASCYDIYAVRVQDICVISIPFISALRQYDEDVRRISLAWQFLAYSRLYLFES